MSKDDSIKVILVGDTGVGKTNLIKVMLDKEFDENSQTTQQLSNFQNQMTYKGRNYKYILWDTSGQEKFRSLNKKFIKDSKILLTVFSIDNLNSFESIDYWISVIKEELKDNNYILALVGNKMDLEQNEKKFDKEIEDKVNKHGIKYKYLSSAKENPEGLKKFMEQLLIAYIEEFGDKIIVAKSVRLNKEVVGKKKRENCC